MNQDHTTENQRDFLISTFQMIKEKLSITN